MNPGKNPKCGTITERVSRNQDRRIKSFCLCFCALDFENEYHKLAQLSLYAQLIFILLVLTVTSSPVMILGFSEMTLGDGPKNSWIWVIVILLMSEIMNTLTLLSTVT